MRTESAMLIAAKICPKVPPGAAGPTNEITGYVLWGVTTIFFLSLGVGLGAVVGGRMVGMRHASTIGIISLVVTFVSGIAYLVLPSMLEGLLGKGCI